MAVAAMVAAPSEQEAGTQAVVEKMAGGMALAVAWPRLGLNSCTGELLS